MKRFLGPVFVALFFVALNANLAFAVVDEAVVRKAWSDACRIAEIDSPPLLFIVDTRAINAWVTDTEDNKVDKEMHRYTQVPQRPDGIHVDVTTGLMKLCETEEEMFGVLCHELGHFVMKSLAESEEWRKRAIVTSSVAAAAFGHGLQSLIAQYSSFSVALNNHGRLHEYEADNYAVLLAIKGRRDPMKGIYSLVERLAGESGWHAFNPHEEHPSDKFRLSNIREQIEQINGNIGEVGLR